MRRSAFVEAMLLLTSGFVLADAPAIEPTAKEEGLAVEDNGVVFEIVVPERDWAVPENEPGSSGAAIELGLRITNTTDERLRFNGFNTVEPELATPDGKGVHRWEGQQSTLRHRQARASDFPLVEPGASVTLSLRADLFWPMLERPSLLFRWWHASGTPGRYFEGLKTGPYRIRLVYENRAKVLEVETPGRSVLEDDAWTGRIVTPFVPVSLNERRKNSA